jgi:hypothetical protein
MKGRADFLRVIIKLHFHLCGYSGVLEIPAHAVEGLYGFTGLFYGCHCEEVGARVMAIPQQESRLL